MAKERRVPRRQSSKQPLPQLGKAPVRHSLKGPNASKAKTGGRRVRAVAASGYSNDYDDGADDESPSGIFVPTRWVKFVAGVLLLPVCWVLSRTFFDEFTRVAVTHRFWATEEFYFFTLGVLLWVITFIALPKPIVIYVFGHELTHALWVWMQLGEVSEFSVGRDGGYIIADRRDFLVSLAPYFFPLYSIIVITGFGIAGHYYPVVWEHRRWLFAAIGVTWAFHITFTLWMIPKQQTDLLLHGTFFSLVIIYIANLCVMMILLIVACPTMTWADTGRELVMNAADFSAMLLEKAGVR